MTESGRLQGGLFFDTSGFFAAANQSDRNHAAAARIMSRAMTARLLLLTTTYVVAESHALFISRLGRHAAVDFLRQIEVGPVTVVRPALADEIAARTIIYRYDDKSFSLTDAISFAVMARLGMRVAFSFDRDFLQYGFELASPD